MKAFACAASLSGEGGGRERDREGRRREQTWVKVLSAIFLIFFFFLFFALLSACRCSSAWDVIFKYVESRSRARLSLDKRIFFSLSPLPTSSVVLRYFSGKQRGGWNKRRTWCRFGPPRRKNSGRSQSCQAAASFERRHSGGRGEGRRLGWRWGSIL